ncbi:hypothetical protein P3B99_002630 [Opitutia bacterium KCR 482]
MNRKNPAKTGGVSFFIGDYINDSVRWQAFGGKRVVFLNKIRVGKIFRFLKKTVSLAANKFTKAEAKCFFEPRGILEYGFERESGRCSAV